MGSLLKYCMDNLKLKSSDKKTIHHFCFWRSGFCPHLPANFCHLQIFFNLIFLQFATASKQIRLTSATRKVNTKEAKLFKQVAKVLTKVA
jgi:hypothetical protein